MYEPKDEELMEYGISEMMPVDAYLLNIVEDDRGRQVHRTYLGIQGIEGRKPLLLFRIEPEGLIGGAASEKLRESFFRKLEGRELPKIGQAKEAREIEEGEVL